MTPAELSPGTLAGDSLPIPSMASSYVAQLLSDLLSSSQLNCLLSFGVFLSNFKSSSYTGSATIFISKSGTFCPARIHAAAKNLQHMKTFPPTDN